MPFLVFVFGTLKEGLPNHSTLQGTRWAGEFMTRERYPLYLVGDRHSPWLVDQPGQGERVCGQVFEVSASALAAMDRLERTTEPDGYLRACIEVERVSSEVASKPVTVFAYLKPAEQFAASTACIGPLSDYTLEHAARYRSRPRL